MSGDGTVDTAEVSRAVGTLLEGDATEGGAAGRPAEEPFRLGRGSDRVAPETTAGDGQRARPDTDAMDRVLTPERLSALMRATWTWDDRALRRDLSGLLVELLAVRHLRDRTARLPRHDTAPGPEASIAALASAAAITRGAGFVADVLGPRITADTGEWGTFAWTEFLLATPALRIVGGTDDSRKDALAEHLPELLADEPTGLRRSVRELLAESSTGEATGSAGPTRIEPGTHDPAVWARMAGELGVVGLAIPRRYGGAGGGFPELRVVLEEQGRALLCSPYLAGTVLAAQTLLAAGDDGACARYLPGIAAGTTIATLAVAERGGAWDPVLAATRATPDGEGWRLAGAKGFVLAGDVADLVLVVARTRGGPSLFAVRAGAPGLDVTPLPTLDGTRPVAALTLDGTPAELVGRAGAASPVVRRAIDLGGLALAAEQVGAARYCLQTAVRHALGSAGSAPGPSQAVRHRLVEMLTRVELADALTEGACLIAGGSSPLAADGSGGRADPAVAATAAHIAASDAFRFVAAETIQVLGDAGLAGDHPAQRYLRRATAAQNLLGGPAVHHERLLDRLGI